MDRCGSVRWQVLAAVVLIAGAAAGAWGALRLLRKPDPWKTLQARADRGQASPVELVRLGEYRLDRGEVLPAFELGLKARKADPGFVGGPHLMGLIYLQTEQFGKAREILTEAVRLAPDQTAPRLNLARSEIALGHPVPALQVLQEALRRDPKNAEVWLLIGTAQHQRGSVHKAAASLRQAVTLDPGLAPAYVAQGKLSLDFGEYADAIPPLEKAYGLGDRDPETLAHLATALLAGRGGPADLQRAESLLNEAGRPDSPSGHLAAALLDQQKGDFKSARGEYENVLARLPLHERALYGLAETQRALGDRAAAAANLQKYDRLVKLRQKLKTLSERLNQEGEKPALLKEYGTGLFEAGRYEEAAGPFRTWARKASSDPEPRRWLDRLKALGITEASPE